jgi:hypothetical protein
MSALKIKMNFFYVSILLYSFTYHVIGINKWKRKHVEAENNLFEKLLNNYNKHNRPSDTVQIKFSLYLNQIVDLDEQQQIITINAYLDHSWNDERLSWLPNEYENIKLLRIDSTQLWKYIY